MYMKNLDMKKLIRHILFSGLIVGSFAYLSESRDSKLAGFLYASLPLGFLYIFFMTKMNIEQKIYFSRASLLGGIFFLIYIGLLYFLLKKEKFNIIVNVLITTVIFILILFLLNRYLYKFL
jgi:hypothetical protein